MGRIKTDHEREMEKLRGGVGIKKAQLMAEAFAKHRARDITREILKGTDIGEVIFHLYEKRGGDKTFEQYLEVLVQDYEMVVGQALAIAYAVGFVDCYEGRNLSQLYVPQGALSKDTEGGK